MLLVSILCPICNLNNIVEIILAEFKFKHYHYILGQGGLLSSCG